MVTQRKTLFRPEALERSASPEQLDQLIQVVSPKRWLSLMAFGVVVSTGLGWSIFGRIPVTVTGRGVLIYPNDVSTVQASSSGRLLSISPEVKVGEPVEAGQIIATLDQSELRSQLDLARNKLVQLQLQADAANQLQSQRRSLDDSAIAQQRQTLQLSLSREQALTPVLQERAQGSIQRERQALEDRQQTLREMLPIYQERWKIRQEIAQEGALSRDDALQAQIEFQDLEEELNQVETQLEQLALKEAEAAREYQRNLDRIAELDQQLQALDTQAASQAEADLIAATTREKEIQETQRTIAQLELELQENSQIRSPRDGIVLELTAQPGQQIEPGISIGVIAAHDDSDHLMSVAFLPVSDGKKVRPDMDMQITPSIVKREEYGSILANVTRVSEFPVTQQGVASLIGNADILPSLLMDDAQVAVFAELERTKDGDLDWSSSQGPETEITYGMTTTVQITVEERSPISYVLPFFRDLLGGGSHPETPQAGG